MKRKLLNVLSTGHRKRKAWALHEDHILITGKRQGKTWVAILKDLDDRTNVDCKDRWRSLLNKHGSEEAIYEEFDKNL